MKINISQTINTLANVGVITGIIFLGFELRQNNELMEADARFNRLLISTDGWDKFAENGELSDIRIRARKGENLTELEQERVDAVVMRILINMEWMYRELPSDSSERNYVQRLLDLQFSQDPTFKKVWNDRKTFFDSNFRQWIDEDIFIE